MKGTKTVPECNFSKYVCAVFHLYGIPYKDVNVSLDTNLKQGLKEFSSWPTVPQVYIKGKFIGGYDIIKEMHKERTLKDLLV
jgi:monothiol glutaredoxin